MANPFGKTRAVENPYAVDMGWSSDIGPIEIRVLRRYKGSVKTESKDPYAKWFTAAKSDATFGSWEYGDQYAGMIRSCYKLLNAEPEWVEQYARRV